MSDAGAPRRSLRILECVILFFLIPPALYPLRHQLAFRVVPIVLALAIVCAIHLVRTGSLDRRSLWNAADLRSHLTGVLAILALGGIAAVIIAAAVLPTRFLALPRQAPGRWALVMLLYPALAAFPQEVIFRAFFFARYGDLFSNPVTLVACNGLSFGLAHLVYGNWLAVSLSTLGGWLFAYRYHRTRSLLLVGLEHGLWGDLLFTIGVGWYLYSGSIQ